MGSSQAWVSWSSGSSVPKGSKRLWVTDITQHHTSDGWTYCCAALDAWSRRVVDWSIAEHIRTERVVDALQMTCWQRRPPARAVVHPDRGSQCTSWLFGHRLGETGLLRSMGRNASGRDDTAMGSFWPSKQVLASAMFDWIEGWYNP